MPIDPEDQRWFQMKVREMELRINPPLIICDIHKKPKRVNEFDFYCNHPEYPMCPVCKLKERLRCKYATKH